MYVCVCVCLSAGWRVSFLFVHFIAQFKGTETKDGWRVVGWPTNTCIDTNTATPITLNQDKLLFAYDVIYPPSRRFIVCLEFIMRVMFQLPFLQIKIWTDLWAHSLIHPVFSQFRSFAVLYVRMLNVYLFLSFFASHSLSHIVSLIWSLYRIAFHLSQQKI